MDIALMSCSPRRNLNGNKNHLASAAGSESPVETSQQDASISPKANANHYTVRFDPSSFSTTTTSNSRTWTPWRRADIASNSSDGDNNAVARESNKLLNSRRIDLTTTTNRPFEREIEPLLAQASTTAKTASAINPTIALNLRSEERQQQEPSYCVPAVGSLSGNSGTLQREISPRGTRMYSASLQQTAMQDDSSSPAAVASGGTRLTSAENFGNIGVDYMRVTGRLTQFKGILNNLDLTPKESKASKSDKDNASVIQTQLDAGMYANSSDDIVTETRNGSAKSPFSLSELRRRTLSGGQEPVQPKSSISYRLGRRKELFEKRRKVCDYALVFSVLGILMMVAETELTSAGVYSKMSIYSFVLKTLIVASTIFLLIFTIAYHAVEVQIFMIDNSVDDWRIAMFPRRVLQIAAELIVNAVCPIPGYFHFTWTTVHSDGVTVTATEVPVDVLLSIPMFLRFYLICRVLLLHSKLFTDTSSRSIGALNRISFNVRFVLKTLMTLCPGTVLLIFTASFCVCASWLLRLCEMHHAGTPDHRGSPDALKHTNFINSLWFIAITFLTVGYGDIVPNTDCGRTVAIITGIMGVGVSSLVVAVIASKLELTMAEKHVHNFMMDTQLSKRVKHAAANVLRETWLIFKYRRLAGKINPARIRHHQRKFLLAIYELRQIKADQRKVNENSLTLGDIAKVSSITHELVADMTSWQTDFNNRMSALEEKMSKLTDVITTAYGLDGARSGRFQAPASPSSALSSQPPFALSQGPFSTLPASIDPRNYYADSGNAINANMTHSTTLNGTVINLPANTYV